MLAHFKTKLSGSTYLLRIMASVIIVAVILVGALTLALYIYGKQALFNIQSDSNEKILKQMRFNIELLHDSVKNTAQYLFVNPDTTFILNNTGALESDEISRRINRITHSVIVSNSFIRSIGFYNSYQDQLFYAGKSIYFNDETFRELLHQYPNVPRMQPIFRQLDNVYGQKTVPEPIITYIMYETSGDPAKIDTAVSINLSADWIIQNIKQIGLVDDQAGDLAFVVSDYSGFLPTNDYPPAFGEQLLQVYESVQDTSSTRQQFGSFTHKIAGTEYVISYTQLAEIGLTIFKLQSVQSVYTYLRTFHWYLLAIFCLFTALAIWMSVKVSRVIYSPIQRLVKETASIAGKDSFQGDEIKYLSEVYQTSLHKLKQLNLETANHHSVIRSHFLRKALLTVMPRHEFEEGCTTYRLPLRYEGHYLIYVLKLDHYAAMRSQFSRQDIELYKFAIMNIFAEVTQSIGDLIEVSFNEDDAVAVLQFHSYSDIAFHEHAVLLKQHVQSMQATIHRLYNISFTTAVSHPLEGVQEWPDGLRHTLNLSKYRFLFGRGTRIDSLRIANNENHEQMSQLSRLQTIFIDNVGQINMVGAQQTLTQIRQQLSGLRYESAIAAVMHLMAALHHHLFASGRIALHEEGQSLTAVWRALWDYETLDDLFAAVIHALDALLVPHSQKALSSQQITDNVLTYIQQHYTDNSLCADLLADQLRIPPRKLGRWFRERSGMSIADAINEVRLKQAAELLTHTSLSVVEIITQVGYENESYFYRIFKKRYGMTPKEFSIRLSSQQS